MDFMYRKITLLGVALTLAYIAMWSLMRVSTVVSDEIQGNIPNPNAEYFDIASLGLGYMFYALTGVVLTLLIMSWWQSHFRAKAIVTSFILLLFLPFHTPFVLLLGPGLGLLTAIVVQVVLPTLLALWLLFWLYLRSNKHVTPLAKPKGPVWFARFSMLLLFLQILLGAWVSYTDSTSACSGFPQCNGQWLPDVDFQGVLNTLLTGTSEASLPVQVALNWSHRTLALVCFILFNGLMLLTTSSRHPKSLRKAGLWLSFLLFVEVALGIIGYKFAMPLWVSAAHTAFAALLMLPLIAISFYSRYGVSELAPPLPQAKPKIDVSQPTPIPAPFPTPAVPEAEVVSVEAEERYIQPAPESLYLRLKSQLGRTRAGLGGLLSSLQIGTAVNKDLLEEIEDSLLMADVGIDVTTKVISHLTQNLERQQLNDSGALKLALKQELLSIIAPCSKPLTIPKQDSPFVILVVGVNGVGKTTTIGKLAKRLKAQGHSVMLAAGDTFRAAAVEQLQTWGERNNIHVVAQHTGADSASVIYDGVQSAKAKGVDVLIADTAGRLHTKENLMEELKKVKRIMAKLDDSAPHEVLLVLDAGTGQNALSQAKQFNEAVSLTGLAITKLDGTAKGGVIFALAKQTGIPIRFIGVGEGIDDLQDFNAENFIDALFVSD